MLNKLQIDFLQNNINLYNKLTSKEKEIFTSKAIPIKVDNNKNLYFSSENCKGFIVVFNGTLRAYLDSYQGKEITLFKLTKGESCILSASCMFKNITFDISIDTLESSEIILLPTNYLEQLSKTNLNVKEELLMLTQKRFSEVMSVMESVIFSTLDNRLITYLKSFNKSTIKITHEKIANDLGTAREVVSRMLKTFENEGLIKLSRGNITIINLDKK